MSESSSLLFEEPVNKRCNPAGHYVPAKLQGLRKAVQTAAGQKLF